MCVLCWSCDISSAQETVRLLDGSFTFDNRIENPSIDDAVKRAKKRTSGFANQSLFELQVHYRLTWLLSNEHYKYEAGHAERWSALMRDEKENMYARLCAAYFLLDDQQEARTFVSTQLKSDNLKHRYNAAEAVRLYFAYGGKGPASKWGVTTLVELLADGSIDGIGDDIMDTPIDRICGILGYRKVKTAVPALISVLERRPQTSGAADALGEIGDEQAIPILLKVLNDKTGFNNSEVTALAKLKCKKAVPILISRLGRPGMGQLKAEKLLEALLQIGDNRAIKPIEEFLSGDYPKESKAVAKRVLVQLSSSDPVQALLGLLESEAYEPERGDIIRALAKRNDDRVVEVLAKIARTSDSAFMRREAISGLNRVGDRQALLALASLLDVEFSKDLKAEWGWKGAPDFREYFPKTILQFLKRRTKQDFGSDRSKWEQWITESFEDKPVPE